MRRVISRRTAVVALATCAVAVLAVAQLLLRSVVQPGPGPTPSSNPLAYSGARSVDFDAGWKFALVPWLSQARGPEAGLP